MIRRWWPWLVIIIIELSLCWPLFRPGYFSHHDDLQVMRIYEMRQCFIDGQIPCRWVTDMGWGNGYPLFNYYSALPYYIGAILSFGFGYVIAAKVLFLIPLVLGGLTMYWLLRELFGRFPAVVGTVLLVMAPYRALDIYVRGAIAESWAISLVPLVLWASMKLIRQGGWRWASLTAVSTAAFLLCHNIMSLFFLPIIGVWVLGWLVKERRGYWSVIWTFGIGFGLAAFFLGPAFLEKGLVQTNNLTKLDLNFRAHFVTWRQLFISRFWGYGASNPGPYDGISFQIGWPQWWLVIPGVILVIGQWRKLKWEHWLMTFWLLAFAGSVVMTHNQSAFLWERLPIYWYAQFPWRWLSVTIIACSAIGAFVFSRGRGQWVQWLGVAIILLAVGLNWSYFRPETFYLNITDSSKLSGSLWEDQRKASIMDYLPVGAIEPSRPAETLPLVRQGEASVSAFINRSNHWQFKAEVASAAAIEMPIYNFPGWQVLVNGQNYPFHKDRYLGRISFNLQPGTYLVSGQFNNTPIRLGADMVSLISLVILLGYIGYQTRRSRK